MSIKIEKGVPLPLGHRKSPVVEAMREMEVGDSVVLPAPMSHVTLYSAARRYGIKIAIRMSQLRVWRVA